MVFLDLGANVGRSRTLGARLSYETDLDTGIQAIEVGAAAAMEEVVVAVFGGDKPESALGDELLDGSRHCVNLLSRTYCLALSRPVRAGPTASAPALGAFAVLPIEVSHQTCDRSGYSATSAIERGNFVREKCSAPTGTIQG